MTEPTRRWITQILVPSIFLFGGLAYMHGPAYLNYFQKQWLDYRLARDSVFGPEQYEVRLKAGFVSDTGEDCLVVVLSDKDHDRQSHEPGRHEVVLVDSSHQIVQRDLHENVGAVQSTHLSPQDGGFAVLEIIRRIPDNRRKSEVARYQVTAQRIDAMESEIRDSAPEWDGRRSRRWRHRGEHPVPRNWWSRDREAQNRDGRDHPDRDRRWERNDRGPRAGGPRGRGDHPEDQHADSQRHADGPNQEQRENDRLPPRNGKRLARDADLATGGLDRSVLAAGRDS